jgi:hypothetical protein
MVIFESATKSSKQPHLTLHVIGNHLDQPQHGVVYRAC